MTRTLFASLFLCAFAFGCKSTSVPELHIFVWGSYIKPEIIEKFEKEHKCRILIDTYDSNEAMYAKLKLGAADYDLILPSNYYLEILTQQGMLQSIRFQDIPNIKNVDPKYLQYVNPSVKPYGIPYLVSNTGIAWRKDKIPHLEPSWGVFSMSQYKGRMTMLNDIREALGAALRYLGFSINTRSEAEVDKASDLLISWKRNLAKFESEQYKHGIASAEYLIVQGYSGDILQVMQENDEVDFLYPEQGTLMSVDYLAIPSKAPNPRLAHDFINYLLQGETAAENIGYTFYLCPNTEAYGHLDPALRNNPILFPPENILKKAEVIKNLDSAYPLYIKAWERVKAAD